MDSNAPLACYVMLHIGTGPSDLQIGRVPPLAVRRDSRIFRLSDDFWIEKLEAGFASNIQRACEPAHYPAQTAPQADRSLYAFVRRVPERESRRYEGMEDLFAVTALSRLVHPTTTGGRYCAKVLEYGSSDSVIQAIQFRGTGPDAFTGNRRDWLSVEDAKGLRDLMPWATKGRRMHGRVHRAYLYHEYAMRTWPLDLRWTLVVSGLEALVSVGDNDLSRQFRARGRRLADELRVGLTEDELRIAYKLRSKLSHGEEFLFGLKTALPQSEHRPLYDKLEQLLRSAVRRCMLEDKFADHFRDEASVEERWPVGQRPPR